VLLRSDLSPIIPVALLVAAFYFLVVRPTKLRQERAQEVEDHLKPGVEVMTSAGLFGRVSSVEGENFMLEIAPGVHAKFIKGAVAKIMAVDEAKKAARPAPGRAGRPGRKKPDAPGAAGSGDTPAAPTDGDEPGPKTL
jgi:preprotein translocase subunit YajC